MQTNDVTFEELKELLEKKYKQKTEPYFFTDVLEEINLYYEEIRTENDRRFGDGTYIIPLKKGVARIKYSRISYLGKKHFTPSMHFSRLTEEDLQELLEWKKQMKRDMELVDFVFEKEKLRTLFLTLNK